MTTQKKNSLLTIGGIAGALLAILALCGVVWSNIVVPKIDEQIDKKTRYMVILLQQMATPEQKCKADEEMKRWGNNKQ